MANLERVKISLVLRFSLLNFTVDQSKYVHQMRVTPLEITLEALQLLILGLNIVIFRIYT